MNILKGTEDVYAEVLSFQRHWEAGMVPEHKAYGKIYQLAKTTYYIVRNKYGWNHPVVQYLKSRYKFDNFFNLYKPISEKDLYQLSRILEINYQEYEREDINKITMQNNMNKPSPILSVLPIYLTTIGSVFLFHYFKIPMYNLVFVIVSTILLTTLTIMTMLRLEDKTSEENFIGVLMYILKAIPGLNWFLKK